VGDAATFPAEGRQRTVALIGSFRSHLAEVTAAARTAVAAGWRITSPRSDTVIEPGIEFVRFPSDPVEWDDPTVQTVAMHRILRADLVYVVAPGGYIGRTTCYEIGRIVQAGRPLFFSDQPRDLPIRVDPAAVTELGSLLGGLRNRPVPALWAAGSARMDEWERSLISGQYLDL
jgi:hypothetical protein